MHEYVFHRVEACFLVLCEVFPRESSEAFEISVPYLFVVLQELTHINQVNTTITTLGSTVLKLAAQSWQLQKNMSQLDVKAVSIAFVLIKSARE